LKRIGLILLLAALVMGAFVYVAPWGGGAYMRFKAARIRAQLESYHSAHGNYPVSLADIPGTPLNGPIYYQRDFDSADVYYLWFGTGFGTVEQYDSKSRTWHGPR
jgi:hypothetical protein